MTDATARPERKITLGKAMVLLAVQAVVMCVLGAVLWQASGRVLSDFVAFSAGELAQGMILGLVLLGTAHGLFIAFPDWSEKLVRLQVRTYGFLGPKLGFPAIVAISLCAGIGEEALFRGGLQSYLGGHIGVPAAIALSSAVFAAIHPARPVITAMVFVIGVLFGVVYWQTGSLLTVMIGHALYDVWALRYLHGEFVRLGLVGSTPPALANCAPGG